MSDRFDDVDLSRALKQSAAESLEGWEFTQAMRTRVLDQIRAMETRDAAPAQRPVRRFNPVQVARPLALVAAAAAAVVLVVRVGIPGFGSMKATESAKPSAAESKMEAPALNATQAPGAPAQESAMKSAEAQPVTAGSAEAKTMAPLPGDGANSYSRQAVAVVDFTLPSQTEPTKVPPDRSLKTAAPPEPQMGIATVQAQNVALSGRGSTLAGLSFDSVQGYDENGVAMWSAPAGGAGNLAVSRDGQVAVAMGQQIQVLNARGEAERNYTASAYVERLAWSADGRVASGEGNLVFVYGVGPRPDFFVDAGLNADVAFAPGGNLAAYGDHPDDAGVLTVTDSKGALQWQARPKTGGRGLAWAAQGAVLVAGGKAYDASGKALWEAPIKTDGVAALDDSGVLVWNSQSVLLLDARSGQVLVHGNYAAGGVGVQQVIAGEKNAAVLSDLGDGTVGLWVIDQAGNIRLAEHLAERPVGMAFAAADRLVLMFPQSVTVKELPQ